ncbi:unnamed protein product [Leptidea sinapis]|uniref:ZAD domain-containing protein n=1 Tax=Leptidea sinapis TaxID=189913 RepID=A0A5E4QF13_9NEOP|nr:unnamed protein product [Leptidea sinapis]
MNHLSVCRVCLATENVKLCRIINSNLLTGYELITGTKIKPLDGLPQHICSYCAAMLMKYKSFRDKCCHAQELQ